jgi:hypothetical protein
MAVVRTELSFYLSCRNTKTACMCVVSHDSSVGIVTMCKLDGQGFESWQRQEIYMIFRMSRLAVGPNQAPIQWICVCFPGEGSGHEADN